MPPSEIKHVMKRIYTDLYQNICHPLNLWTAYKKAARGKRYRPAAAAFNYDLERNLIEMEQELISETYLPGTYHNFHIQSPKRRLISAAPFRDRVVHHALMNIIEPLFERQFIYDSYANRNGKGTHAALDRCTHPAAVSLGHALRRAPVFSIYRPPNSAWDIVQDDWRFTRGGAD